MWPFRRREDRAASLTLEQVLADQEARTRAGIAITGETALRLPAVSSCVRLISRTIGSLPVHVFREGTRDEVPSPAFFTRPAARSTFGQWTTSTLRGALVHGNTFGLVTARGAAQRPTQIDLLARHRVHPGTDPESGELIWRLDGKRLDDPEQLWHFRDDTDPGEILGRAPIADMAETIALGLAAQEFGAALFGDGGGIPSGILTTEQVLRPDVTNAAIEKWKATHGGKRGTAMLTGGLKFQKISVSPEEGQFLGVQEFVVQQVARAYGIPPEMIGADSGNSMTYANVEQRDLTLLKYTLAPWITLLEDYLGQLLPRTQYAKFNVAALLRADTKARYEAHAIGLEHGFLTIDEVRDLEDREPLPANVVTLRPAAPEGIAA